MKNNKVSIITPSYNSTEFIEITIQSVQRQVYSDWEMIIVDDGSTDDTVFKVKSFADQDYRIILLQNETNMGQGYSRNRAIKAASGRYIAFLDSDDVWHPEKLKIQIGAMRKRAIAFSHTSFGYINKKGEAIKSPFEVSEKPVTYTHLLKHAEISCLTAIYDADILGKVYMPEIRRSQDYALWLDLLKKTNSIPINQVLAYYRLHDQNISKNKFKKISLHWKVLREYEKLSLLNSMYYFSFWAVNGFYKYFIR